MSLKKKNQHNKTQNNDCWKSTHIKKYFMEKYSSTSKF